MLAQSKACRRLPTFVVQVNPTVAHLNALARRAEGLFRVVEMHHRIGALSHHLGHDVAQQRGLAGARWSIDSHDTAGSEFGKRQVDRRLL